MKTLIIIFSLVGWASSQTCSVPNTASEYRAPPREVPYQQVDEDLKRDFLQLFNRGSQRRASSLVRPQNDFEHPPPIDPAIVQKINSLIRRNDFFYSVAPRHVQAIALLQEVFMGQETPRDVYRVAKEELERDEINRRIWYYALLGVLRGRADLSGYYAAWEVDATPDLFLTWTVIQRATQRPNFQLQPQTCTLSEGSRGSSRNAENSLWYFREDPQLNQRHWYWHQYNPLSYPRVPDRKGELFFYFHHNIIARYNAERIANGLRIEDALDLRPEGIIAVGFNPDLKEMVSGKMWTPRDPNTRIQDINHLNDPDIQLDISIRNTTGLHDILRYHIDQGVLIANRSLQTGRPPMEFVLDIRDPPGLSSLGGTVEADDVTVNADLYHPWGIHNLIHVIAALSRDPNYRQRLPPGVVGDLTASMRDTVFYQVHTLVDHLYERYQRTLPPYQIAGGEWPLIWPGVNVVSLKMLSQTTNVINTFWQVTRFPLGEGIDGTIHDGSRDITICQRHLNHAPFKFKLEVDIDTCWNSTSGRGTVRLFMAPRFDSNRMRFSMTRQRSLMFQLDVFPVELRPGRNVIIRNSTDSSLAKPWTRSLKEMLENPSNGGEIEECGCGWPQHLYIPKGTSNGMQFDLFAIVTNYDEDVVENSAEDLRVPESCNSPYILCGIPNRKYPDARPMGYPFDRLPYYANNGAVLRPVLTVEEYVSKIPNAQTSIVTVRHSNS